MSIDNNAPKAADELDRLNIENQTLRLVCLETAAERDRLKAVNVKLIEALDRLMCYSSVCNDIETHDLDFVTVVLTEAKSARRNNKRK